MEESVVFEEFNNFGNFQINKHTSDLRSEFGSDGLDLGEQHFSENLSLLVVVQIGQFSQSHLQLLSGDNLSNLRLGFSRLGLVLGCLTGGLSNSVLSRTSVVHLSTRLHGHASSASGTSVRSRSVVVSGVRATRSLSGTSGLSGGDAAHGVGLGSSEVLGHSEVSGRVHAHTEGLSELHLSLSSFRNKESVSLVLGLMSLDVDVFTREEEVLSISVAGSIVDSLGGFAGIIEGNETAVGLLLASLGGPFLNGSAGDVTELSEDLLELVASDFELQVL